MQWWCKRHQRIRAVQSKSLSKSRGCPWCWAVNGKNSQDVSCVCSSEAENESVSCKCLLKYITPQDFPRYIIFIVCVVIRIMNIYKFRCDSTDTFWCLMSDDSRGCVSALHSSYPFEEENHPNMEVLALWGLCFHGSRHVYDVQIPSNG